MKIAGVSMLIDLVSISFQFADQFARKVGHVGYLKNVAFNSTNGSCCKVQASKAKCRQFIVVMVSFANKTTPNLSLTLPQVT